MTRYTFAIAGDPTPAFKEKALRAAVTMAAKAKQGGRSVSVEFAWASDLRPMLQAAPVAIQRYWFDERILPGRWWDDRLRAAGDIALAVPPPGVVARVSALVAAICGEPAWREYLTTEFLDRLDELSARDLDSSDIGRVVAGAVVVLRDALGRWIDEPSPDTWNRFRAAHALATNYLDTLTAQGQSGRPDSGMSSASNSDGAGAGGLADSTARDTLLSAVRTTAKLANASSPQAAGSSAAVLTARADLLPAVVDTARQRATDGRRTVVIVAAWIGHDAMEGFTNAFDVPGDLSISDVFDLLDLEGRLAGHPVLIAITGATNDAVVQRLGSLARAHANVRLMFTTSPEFASTRLRNFVLIDVESETAITLPESSGANPKSPWRMVGIGAAVAALLVALIATVFKTPSGEMVQPSATPVTPTITTPPAVDAIQIRLDPPVWTPEGVRIRWAPTPPNFDFVVDLWQGSEPMQPKPVERGVSEAIIEVAKDTPLCIRVRGTDGRGAVALSNVVTYNSPDKCFSS